MNRTKGSPPLDVQLEIVHIVPLRVSASSADAPAALALILTLIMVLGLAESYELSMPDGAGECSGIADREPESGHQECQRQDHEDPGLDPLHRPKVSGRLVDKADRSIRAEGAARRQWIQLRIEEGPINVAGTRRHDGVVASADDHPGNRGQQMRS